jgi:ABC-type multidrug transport system fused ATPase/permease subunit
VGAFGACIIAFKAMQDTTRLFLMNIGRFPEQIAYAKDYYSYLELNAGAPTEDSQNKYGFALSEGITVSNLCFKYPNSDDFALEGVSFEVKAGEKIAILGINGSGKTTLSKLLLGLYHPQQGEILFDSHSIEDIERDSFLMNVSIVSQCFIQYQMTLRENIAISQTDDLENDDRIYASLSLFPEDDILHNYELDTVLGKQFGEVELSGGQWQKIAIARGAFKHSKFIILDEPTSALDPLVEGEVLQSFLNTIRNKTAVFVSHRLGFAKLLDRIIILDQGKIVDIGTHDDLMNRCSLYKTMFTEQQKWHQHELILDMEG